LEDFGFRYIESLLKPFKENLGQEVRDAWLEFERRETKEAQYMYEMDKFECMIQAHEYEQRTHGSKDLEEFQGLSSKITSAEGTSWLKLLQRERQHYFSKRRQRIPVIFVIGIPLRGVSDSVLTILQVPLALAKGLSALSFPSTLASSTYH